MALVEEAQRAARILRGHAYVRIAARLDGDALCAAALLAHALRREGIDFHATFAPRLAAADVTRLSEERNDALVLVGLSDDAHAAPAAGSLVPIDHGEHDAALATRAHLVAVSLAARNVDLAPLALAGALAARRHIRGFRGADANVHDEATRTGAVQDEIALALRGGTLLAALTELDDPCVTGLSGRARNANKLVAELHLSGEAPPTSLSSDDAEKLGSALALKLLQQGAPDAALDALYRPRLVALKGPHTGHDAAELALLAEAAAATGKGGAGFAALWPDESAAGELGEVAAAMRRDLVAALLKAERELRHEGPLAWAEAPTPGLARGVADRLAVSIVPEGRLVLARAATPPGTEIALRAFGGRDDLGALARSAAKACGGVASGSAGEARALVPAAEEERFRKLLSEGWTA